MHKSNTKCRVCGKEYFCCSDSKKVNSWRTMACSVECFQEYMNRIEKSRNPITEKDIMTEDFRNDTTSKTKNRKRKSTDLEIISEDNII